LSRLVGRGEKVLVSVARVALNKRIVGILGWLRRRRWK
jgi:hypothetical protein